MFKIFKKDNNIYAPAKGRCKDISECKDYVFSSKMMGDGIFIIPEGDIIYSPVDGVIKAVFPTKHAFGFELSNGQEVMLHIGINTVKLNGEHMELLYSEKRVKKGTPLIRFDKDFMEANEIDMSTIVVLIQNDHLEYEKKKINEDVDIDEVLMINR